ncbi:MAG: TldD/PmbA family protein [Actinomycetota bacterium]|nr:TldD/PmbA family protein [Actinomycetota bacterium]
MKPGSALELAEQALRAVEGDEAEVLVHAERSGLARFADSSLHQPTLVEDTAVTVRVARDGKVGAASTNRLGDGVEAAARRAAEAAESAPRDPSFSGLPRAAPAPLVEGCDEETAALAPGDQAELAWRTIRASPGFPLYGYFTSGVTDVAVASTTGLAVSQRMTDATVLALAASEDASGYAEATAWKASEIDVESVAREAAEKAERTRGAGGLAAGTYSAVLEPYAFAELLWYFAFTSLSALSLLEGRSYLSARLGERLFDEGFSLVDDGRDPRGLPKAFDFEGVPKQRVPLVENGVARDVVWDRRTGARAGRESTGHALPAPAQRQGPIPFNLAVPPGDASLAELAERVGEGIYVTRAHYLNIVDPRQGVLTGMSRDGTFRIEGGRVTRPLVNLRFTTSFPRLLERLLGLSADVKLVSLSDYYDERYPYGALVPAVATEAFTVVATGSAPGV